METNKRTNAWPMRIELDTVDAVYAAEFGIDVNAERGETVGWRVLPGRWIEVDSIDDAYDLAGYVRREAESAWIHGDPAREELQAAMHADADLVERAAARNARGGA